MLRETTTRRILTLGLIMSRTTAEAVGKLVEVPTGFDLAPFIETASALVDDCCASVGYDATRLELIERWLSCHFFQMREQAVESEKAGSVSAKYRGKVDLALNVTHYGQQAMILDTKGGLARHNKQIVEGKSGIKIGVTHLAEEDDA